MWRTVFLDARGRLRAGWRFLLAAIITVLLQIVAGFVARFLVPASAGQLPFEMTARTLALVALVAAYSGLVKTADLSPESGLAAQGLDASQPWLKHTVVGLMLGVVMIAAGVGMIAMVGRYQREPFHAESYATLGLLVCMILIAAALEEVAFRGYPFQKLVEGIGPWAATLALSGAFGLAHLGNPHASVFGFLNTVLVGMLLSLAYLRTRALWLPIGIHFAWNFALGTLFGLNVSGLGFFAVLGKGQASGPEWLAGGDYGIEASLTGTVVIILGTVGVWIFTRKNDFTRNAAAPASL